MRPILAAVLAAALFVAMGLWLARDCTPGDTGFRIGTTLRTSGCK